MFRRKSIENGHLVVQLQHKDGNYYIENIPVNINHDNKCNGYRIIQVKSLITGTIHLFRVCSLHKHKSINSSNGLLGIILSNSRA